VYNRQSIPRVDHGNLKNILAFYKPTPKHVLSDHMWASIFTTTPILQTVGVLDLPRLGRIRSETIGSLRIHGQPSSNFPIECLRRISPRVEKIHLFTSFEKFCFSQMLLFCFCPSSRFRDSQVLPWPRVHSISVVDAEHNNFSQTIASVSIPNFPALREMNIRFGKSNVLSGLFFRGLVPSVTRLNLCSIPLGVSEPYFVAKILHRLPLLTKLSLLHHSVVERPPSQIDDPDLPPVAVHRSLQILDTDMPLNCALPVTLHRLELGSETTFGPNFRAHGVRELSLEFEWPPGMEWPLGAFPSLQNVSFSSFWFTEGEGAFICFVCVFPCFFTETSALESSERIREFLVRFSVSTLLSHIEFEPHSLASSVDVLTTAAHAEGWQVAARDGSVHLTRNLNDFEFLVSCPSAPEAMLNRLQWRILSLGYISSELMDFFVRFFCDVVFQHPILDIWVAPPAVTVTLGRHENELLDTMLPWDEEKQKDFWIVPYHGLRFVLFAAFFFFFFSRKSTRGWQFTIVDFQAWTNQQALHLHTVVATAAGLGVSQPQALKLLRWVSRRSGPVLSLQEILLGRTYQGFCGIKVLGSIWRFIARSHAGGLIQFSKLEDVLRTHQENDPVDTHGFYVNLLRRIVEWSWMEEGSGKDEVMAAIVADTKNPRAATGSVAPTGSGWEWLKSEENLIE
jgi:hypothetical protein